MIQSLLVTTKLSVGLKVLTPGSIIAAALKKKGLKFPRPKGNCSSGKSLDGINYNIKRVTNRFPSASLFAAWRPSR